MNQEYKEFRDQVFSAMHELSKNNEIFSDARMLLGAAETNATLSKQDILKSIDTDWIDAIEHALPHLDVVIRKPSVAIEDVEEILPVEVSRHINDRSVKHLAQHTNLILDIKGDEITPQKILNVYRDETYLTYENKFVNTLLSRLSVFVEKRYSALVGGRGTERRYKLGYDTKFEHVPSDDGGRNSAHIEFSIELTSPLNKEIADSETDINEKYAAALERIARINRAVTSYRSSAFAEKLGRAYIRPPVIRTNAILKNKDMKECLKLWEYIESFDRIGYSIQADVETEMPSGDYVSDLYSAVALQYVNFYNGVAESDSNRMLSRKRITDMDPEFSAGIPEEDFDDYKVYDSDYKRMVPVSRLIANPPKLSKDEKRIAEAIRIALEADAILTERRKAEEAARRAAEEARRLREEEERRRAEEEERRRIASEEARRLAVEEARRRAEEDEERRIREEEERLRNRSDREKLIAEARRYALEQAAKNRAAWKYAPEDDDYEGTHPLCPFKWSEYSLFPRKKKKQIKLTMDKVSEYSRLQRSIRELEERAAVPNDELAALKASRDAAADELPQKDGWREILKYHTGEDKRKA